MKRIISVIILLFSICSINSFGQENYGNTLNLGIGVGGYSGYYSHASQAVPVVNVNYEFNVIEDFTLAPFITFYTYTNKRYWGDKNHPHKNYLYRQTVTPIGVKATYYFDNVVNANSKWDFYVGLSLGYAIISSSWEDGYNGDPNYYKHGSTFFNDFHLGAEYHVNNKIGLFLDLSNGTSTIGIAIHTNK